MLTDYFYSILLLMSLTMSYSDWPNRIVDSFLCDFLRWHLINIRLNLRLTIARVLLDFGLGVVIIVHDLGAKGHLMDAVAYFHCSMMVLVNYSANMQRYLVMVTVFGG